MPDTISRLAVNSNKRITHTRSTAKCHSILWNWFLKDSVTLYMLTLHEITFLHIVRLGRSPENL